MPTVIIKQIPDDYAEFTGLAKKNRSRMPGTRDIFHAAKGKDGRFITGIDEDAYDLPKDLVPKVKAKREFLEKKIGEDLTGRSEFWETFGVVLESDNVRVLDRENPKDEIAYYLLISNGHVAPNKEAAFTSAYKESQYYAYTEESEATEETSLRKKRDTALSHLLNISGDKDKMVLYGQYLEGLKYSSKLPENTLYKMLRAYIEDKDIKNATNFNAVIKTPLVEIQQKIIVDKALKQRIISRVTIGKGKQVYQYGQITLGNTVEELYKNLSQPDFAPELMSLKAEIDKR